MAQRSATLLVLNEADVQLAVSSIKSHQIQSNRRAATVYNVSERTIRRRRAGKLARRDCQPNSKKLTQLEEEVIVSHILDLDLRGFAPTYAAVRDMANRLVSQGSSAVTNSALTWDLSKRSRERTVRKVRGLIYRFQSALSISAVVSLIVENV
jgi:hypothetical protein